MRVGLIAVGRLKAGPERELFTRFVERFAALGPQLGFSALELREIEESRGRRSEDRRAAEARAIAEAIPPGARVIAFDERGASLSSAAFARELAKARDAGQAHLSLIIGGPDGLAEEVRGMAHLTIAFGAATWPHQLVRVMVAEQLYRAATILTGHPYHR